MKLFRRHILTIIALLLYWPGIFILTHIPIPAVPLFKVRVSDKTLHFFAYFVLVFLLWCARNPNTKVNWRKPAVWWILFIVAWYGVMDEWLQGYVGRSPDVVDFIADLCGAIAALILLSILNFWTAALIVTGGAIFIFTNIVRANPGDFLALPGAIFYLISYIVFTILWIRWMYHFVPVRVSEPKRLIGALSLPMGFLILTDLFSLVATESFSVISTTLSVVGIVSAVFAVYLIPRLRREIS